MILRERSRSHPHKRAKEGETLTMSEANRGMRRDDERENFDGEGEMWERDKRAERSFRHSTDVRRGCLLDVKSDTL